LGGILKTGILSGKSYSEIKSILEESGFSDIPAEKVTYWLYRRRIKDFMEMNNLPKKLRGYLNNNFSPGFYDPSGSFLSDDLSTKYLFKTRSGYPVESVYIPDNKRNTICISSQAGCRMACTYCHTGKIGFHGNLGTDEILNQVVSIKETDNLTHVVFMGMGEPLDNYHNVLRALNILTAQWGFAFSPRNITVSTIGLKPRLEGFIGSTRCNIAISFHSPFDEERDELIPSCDKYSVEELLGLIRTYKWEKNRRVTFQYIMIDGVNDSDIHLDRLICILKGTTIRINLMNYHPFEGSTIQNSPDHIKLHFKKQLIKNGISASIRISRGQDIGAACGLLGIRS
jgi:23S rRNA (adenine2503-C2)-methyltransferase